MIARLIAIFTVIASVGLTGCTVSIPTVVGSGNAVTEQRQVGSFSRVRVGAAIDATVIVGPDTTVAVTADDNIVSSVRTSVAGDLLTVDMQGSFVQATKVTVAITTPTLTGAEANSAATLTATGVVADRFSATAESAGSLIVRGQASSVEVVARSDGSADLGGVPAQDASASLDSAGRAVVNAAGTVSGNVSSAAVLTVEGNPAQVNVTTDSSGRVVRD